MNIPEGNRQKRMPGIPIVSVIMGVYNRKQFLDIAIESLLRQSLRDCEFILVDDGSTDGSADILAAHARQDGRIVLISNANNQGISKSLNLAIARAQADYLAVMDSDDVALPHRLEKEFQFLEDHPEMVLVGSHAMLVDFGGAEIRADVDLPTSHRDIDEALLGSGWPLIHPSVMMRSSAVRDIGGYNESYRSNVDHEIFLRLAEKGQLANLEDVLVAYRVHHRAMTAQRTSRDHNYVQQAIREACARRSLPYPPGIKPRNPGLTSKDIYWKTGVRGFRQLGRLLIRSPRAFCGQLLLAIRRSARLRNLFRARTSEAAQTTTKQLKLRSKR